MIGGAEGLLATLLLAGSGEVRLPVDFLAARARDALLVGNAAQLDEVAARTDVDPFLLVAALRCVEPDPPWAALEALVHRLEGRPGARELGALLECWTRLGPEDHARERRLWAALRVAEGAHADREWPRIREVVAAHGADLDAARCSVAAAALLGQAAAAAEGELRWTLASARHEEAARAALGIAWWEMLAWELQSMALLAARQGRPREAMHHYEAARATWEDLGERRRVAIIRLNQGILLMRQGEYEEARRRLRSGLEAFVSLGDGRGMAHALTRLAEIEHTLGRLDESSELVERALPLHRAAGDGKGLASCLSAQATILIARGSPDRALGLYEEALEIARREADLDHIVALRNHLANCLRVLGRQEDALRELETAAREAAVTGDPWRVMSVEASLARVCSDRGSYAAALEHAERAAGLARELAARRYIGEYDVQRGHIHLRLRDTARAERLMREGARVLEQAGAPVQAADAWMGLSGALEQAGRLDEAREALERAIEQIRDLGSPDRLAVAMINLGVLRHEAGDLSGAMRATRRGLQLARSAGNRPHAAQAMAHLGTILRELGRLDEAQETLERARRELKLLGGSGLLASVEANLAVIEAAGPRPLDALPRLREVLVLFRRLGWGMGETGGLGLRGLIREASDVALQAIAGASPSSSPDLLREAFWFAESGRGLLLLEGLVNRELLASARLPEELRGAHAAARSRLERGHRRLLEAVADDDPEEVRRRRSEQDAALAALEEVVARMQRQARSVAEVLYPEPAGLDAVQRGLPEETALLLYQTTPRRVFVLRIDRGSTTWTDLGDRKELMDLVEAWLGLLPLATGADAPDARQAEALYDRLLRPLEADLGGVGRLLLCPDGALAFVPFEALVRDGERVLDRWEIAYVPSATIHAALRDEAGGRPPGRGLVAVGDPVYPGEGPEASVLARGEAERRELALLPRLPGSGEEARAIAMLFPEEERVLLLREEASLERVRELFGRPRERLFAVHLAGHGHLDTHRPALTGLFLAGGKVLSLDEVHSLHIPAELAVLSGCETGRGAHVQGEGILGLVRGFFLAGCLRVVVSNWRVEDRATRRLMEDFYRELLGGSPPARALREAKRRAIQARGAGPGRWAAFVLWGLPE